MTSIYNKPQSQFIGVADDVSIGGGVLRMPLNRDDFTVEHAVNIRLDHAASVAPTAAGNAISLIEKVEIETERGVEFTTNGRDLVSINEITESINSQRNTFGLANVIEFGFELHSEMDSAAHDLLTAIESGQRTKYNLIITFAKSAAAVLTGGTLSGTPSYTVNVEAKTYPELSGIGAIEDPNNEYFGIASLVHRLTTNEKSGNSSGQQQPIQLTSAGSLLRFLSIACFDTTGATPVPSDSIVEGVRLVAGGREVFNSTFKNMQRRNDTRRNLNRLGSGIAFIDYGDDVNEWLDMGDVQDARLILTVSATAPASYSIHSTEDFVAQA